MRTFLHILWMWSGVRTKKYFRISTIYESLYRDEILGILQRRLAVEMGLECMPSLLVMRREEEMLWRDRSIEIRVFLALDELCHLSRTDMFDDDHEFWVFLGYPLRKSTELTLSTVDKSLGNLPMAISRDGRLRMEREDNTTLYHRFEYRSSRRIIGIDITSRSARVRRDSSWIVLHRSDLASTRSDDLWSRRRLE
jgi:hypothetical protein